MSVNTTIARTATRLALCLTLGAALVAWPAYAQNDNENFNVKKCMRANKIEFHNENSGFTLAAMCTGKGVWTVTLVGDVLIGEFIVASFTIEHEEHPVFDASLAIGQEDIVAKRELKIETVDKDRIDIEFKRDKKKR